MDELKQSIRNLTAPRRRELLAVLLDTIAGDNQPRSSAVDPETKGAQYVSAMNGILGINILQQDRHRDFLWGRNCVIWKMTLDGFTEEQIARVIPLNPSTICNSRKQMKNAFQFRQAYPFAISLWDKFTSLYETD